jgi:predicted MFS family arabinose efflux permease
MFLVAYFPSYPLGICFALLWGWGGAALWGGSTMQTLKLTEGVRSRHGLGMGLLYLGTHAGWLSGVIALGLVLAHRPAAPQLLYAVAAAITFAALVLAIGLPRDSQVTITPPTVAMLWQIATRSKALIAMSLLGTSALAFGLILGTFADYVKAEYGAQYIWITAMFYPGTRAVLSLLSGVLSDLGGRAPVLALSFLLGAVGCALAATWHTPVALAITATCLGLVSGAVPVVSASLVGDSAERKRRPLAYGVLFTGRDLGTVAGLVGSRIVGGAAADLRTSFVLFAALFALCAGISAMLQRHAAQRL